MTSLLKAESDEESTVNHRTARGAGSPGGALSAAYVLELRRQIREDAYRTVEVADEAGL